MSHGKNKKSKITFLSFLKHNKTSDTKCLERKNVYGKNWTNKVCEADSGAQLQSQVEKKRVCWEWRVKQKHYRMKTCILPDYSLYHQNSRQNTKYKLHVSYGKNLIKNFGNFYRWWLLLYISLDNKNTFFSSNLCVHFIHDRPTDIQSSAILFLTIQSHYKQSKIKSLSKQSVLLVVNVSFSRKREEYSLRFSGLYEANVAFS